LLQQIQKSCRHHCFPESCHGLLLWCSEIVSAMLRSCLLPRGWRHFVFFLQNWFIVYRSFRFVLNWSIFTLDHSNRLHWIGSSSSFFCGLAVL
jgi:hypothetical protein